MTRVLLATDRSTPLTLPIPQREADRMHWHHVDRLRAALDLLAREQIDIVLLDLDLPDSQGIDTFRALRRRFSVVPVIILSDNNDEELALQSVTEGAQDYLVKSLIGPSTLTRSIRYAIERGRIEDSLRDKEAKLAEAVQIARLGFWSRDLTTGLLDWSPGLFEIFGVDPATFGRTLEDFLATLHPDDRSGVQNQIKQAIARIGSFDHFYRVLVRGQVRTIHEVGRVFAGPDGKPCRIAGTAQDVTERRSLEQQLRQSQKMEAVGQLAGGVAHDFNNLLTIINGYSDLLLQKLSANDPIRPMISEISKAGERSAALTRQLLAFSRMQIQVPRLLQLNDVVTEADKMLQRLIGANVVVSIALDPALWAVRADPGQLDQVLLNLALNARDAMPGGGRLLIETRNVDLDEAYCHKHREARPGPQVLLRVTDTGTGIDPEILGKIFEPFFTTKGPGKGTGLGLATVYGIVRQSGGHVTVTSQVGSGTTFEVYLPRAEKPVSEGRRPISDRQSPPRGTETILIAEDEDGVRKLTRDFLNSCGYTVLTAANGAEAVEVAKNHPLPIDLLISDLVMPELDGREVATRIAKRHAGVRVLFVSGYTDDCGIRNDLLRDSVNFLQKPYVPFALAVKVRDVLESPSWSSCTSIQSS